MVVDSRLEQSLRDLLSEAARDGTLAPGAKLPTERQLVERFAAPRSVVRKALEVFEAEGLVLRQVGRGTFLTDAARGLLETASADTSPAEIMQARSVIEPSIASLAARVATQSDLDRVGECLDAGGAATDFQDFETWDGRLHRAMALAAHNGLLLRMFDVVNDARELPVWGSLKRRTFTMRVRDCYHDEHAVIVEALRDRDAEGAHQAMKRHLETVADNLLGRH